MELVPSMVRPGERVPRCQLHSVKVRLLLTRNSKQLRDQRPSGLFFGQISSTTGYEEAARKGTFASTNAEAGAKTEWSGHLAPTGTGNLPGVLVDDLITKGVTSPTACSPAGPRDFACNA
jgi:folate-dependent tRNA-U54 methylase TrmFO/GidA